MAVKTAWLDAPDFVKWLMDEGLAGPIASWKIVEVMRSHKARKLVLEDDKSLTRYTIKVREVSSHSSHRTVEFRITLRPTEPREPHGPAVVMPLDAHENWFRCLGCNTAFESESGFVLCPNDVRKQTV